MRKRFLWGLLILQFLMADAASAMFRRGVVTVQEALEMGFQRHPYSQRRVSPPQPAPGSRCAKECKSVCGNFVSCRYPAQIARSGMTLSDLAVGYLVYRGVSSYVSNGSDRDALQDNVSQADDASHDVFDAFGDDE